MRLFFTLLVLLNTVLCMAQGIMVPHTTTIRTPYGNVNSTSYSYMQMNYGNQTISAKYNFEIVLSADSSLNSRAKINFSEERHRIKVKTKHGRKILTPSDTKEIYRITDKGDKMKGIPADSCWLFKTVEGKINAYAFLPEGEYSYVTAIQDGNTGRIVPLTRKNLENMVGMLADPKVLKLIENKKLIKALQMYNEGN